MNKNVGLGKGTIEMINEYGSRNEQKEKVKRTEKRKKEWEMVMGAMGRRLCTIHAPNAIIELCESVCESVCVCVSTLEREGR